MYTDPEETRKALFSGIYEHTSVLHKRPAFKPAWEYYLELGVRRTASVEEIRKAYRRRARAIHPDRQTDPKLRLEAEDHMRALNQILSVLVDPVQRQQYDRGQVRRSMRFRPRMVVTRPFWQRMRRRLMRSRWVHFTALHWFWIFGATLAILTLSSLALLGRLSVTQIGDWTADAGFPKSTGSLAAGSSNSTNIVPNRVRNR